MSARLRAALVTAALTLPCVAFGQSNGDGYLQGYVSATLEPERLGGAVLGARDGVVYLDTAGVSAPMRARVETR